MYTCTGDKSVQITEDISPGTQDYKNIGEESESPVQIVKVNGTSWYDGDLYWVNPEIRLSETTQLSTGYRLDQLNQFLSVTDLWGKF